MTAFLEIVRSAVVLSRLPSVGVAAKSHAAMAVRRRCLQALSTYTFSDIPNGFSATTHQQCYVEGSRTEIPRLQNQRRWMTGKKSKGGGGKGKGVVLAGGGV